MTSWDTEENNGLITYREFENHYKGELNRERSH